MMNRRDRLIERVSRSVMWGRSTIGEREHSRNIARHIVDDLLSGSAEGKATERVLRTVVAEIEKSA